MRESNRRIVKNTIFLYFRMFLILLVTLYTSRVVLKELGIEDYGIYDVVGGVVAMFAVITTSLSNAISRFITFEIGRGNIKRIKVVFATSLSIQLFLSLLVCLLSEVLGTWFLNTQMNIPAGRIDAANWVMQISIIIFVVNLISVPYNATIIAHEHMQAFAYISILEAVLKLGIAFAIGNAFFDRLIFYVVLLLLISIVVTCTYIFYSLFYFAESRSLPSLKNEVFKEIFSFASWNFLGALSGVLQTQGINILLNIFFGPAVNAARGVAVQVENAIQKLGISVATAINPQIIKTYAMGDSHEMNLLMCRGTKFVFFLLFVLTVPVVVGTDFILSTWLVEVPEYTKSFLILLLISLIVDASTNSLYTGIMATGKIKIFVFLNSGIRLLIIPVGYIFLKSGFSPVAVFVVQFFFICITQVPRMVLVHRLTNLPYKMFFKEAVRPIGLVFISTFSIIYPLILFIHKNTWWCSPFLIVISFIISCLCIFTLGMDKKERELVVALPAKIINKIQSK